MKVAIVIAHAAWKPHQGGGNTELWSEHDLSRHTSNLTAANLRAIGCEPKLLDMPGSATEGNSTVFFRCKAKHSRYQDCARYNAGLVWIATEARRYAAPDGIAISFHFGRGKPGWRGPLCLVNDAPLARRFARGYLETFHDLSGLSGRGIWELPKDKKYFPRNPVFLRRGPRSGSILIEMGNAASLGDSNLFDNENGIGFAIESAVEGVRAITN